MAELVIYAEEVGGWMREAWRYDDEGTLIAVANMARLQARTGWEPRACQTYAAWVIIVGSVEDSLWRCIIDSAMVMATQGYVDDGTRTAKNPVVILMPLLKKKGFSSSVTTDSESQTLAATPKAVKTAYERC